MSVRLTAHHVMIGEATLESIKAGGSGGDDDFHDDEDDDDHDNSRSRPVIAACKNSSHFTI